MQPCINSFSLPKNMHEPQSTITIQQWAAQSEYSSISQKGMEAVLLAFAVCYTGTGLAPLQHSSSPYLHLPEYCLLLLIIFAASEQGHSQGTSNHDQNFLASTSKAVSFSLHLFICLQTIFNTVLNVSIWTFPISSNKLLLSHIYPSQVYL